MLSIWEQITQWLVGNLYIIFLSLPGVAGFIWKFIDWRRARKLQSESLMPRIDMSFESTCFSKALDHFVSGNLLIENTGDLTTEIKGFNIQIKTEGDIQIEKALFYRDPHRGEYFEIISSEWSEVKYDPRSHGKWLIIEPKRKFIIPILIQYRETGNGDLLVNVNIFTRVTKRLDIRTRDKYNDEIEKVDKKLKLIEDKKRFYRTLYELYGDIHSEYKKIELWHPRPSHQEDLRLTLAQDLVSFLKKFQYRLRTIGYDYNIQKFSNLAREKIDIEKIYSSSRDEIVNDLSSLSTSVKEIIEEVCLEECKEKEIALKHCLLNLRTAIVASDREAIIKELQKFQETKKISKDEQAKALRTQIDAVINSLKFAPQSEVERKELLETTYQWEWFEQLNDIYIEYLEAYDESFSKYGEEKIYEFDEIFYVSTPEALVESKTIVDLEFKYDIIQLHSERYLQGRLILINKRNVKTRYQGFTLNLEPANGSPSIKFYDPQTKNYESRLDLLQTELVQTWLYVYPETLEHFNVKKVAAVTLPYMVENIDFVVKIQGMGFFKLTAELVCAPIVSDRENFYNLDQSAKNIEIFIGSVGLPGAELNQNSSMQFIEPVPQTKFSAISPAGLQSPKSGTQILQKPSATPPHSSSNALDDLDKLKETLYDSSPPPAPTAEPTISTGMPTFGTPQDKEITIKCPNCGSIYSVDSKTTPICPNCNSMMEKNP